MHSVCLAALADTIATSVLCSSGLGPIGLRSDFENRGEVINVVIELDEDEPKRCSLENCPGFEAESCKIGI